jgi:hypothetical protein
MAFFGKILEKLGFGSTAESPTTVAPSNSAPASASASPTASSAPQPVAVVDVVAQLEQRATANPQKLNWRTSIVDLLSCSTSTAVSPRAKSWPPSWAAPPI